MSASVRRLTTLISLLSGPPINPSEIEWALEVPAGKTLIDWLGSQLGEAFDVDPDISEETRLKAAVARIGLEHDELLENPHAGPLLSQVKKRVQAIEAESSLLEDELEILKRRLAQTRVATQKTKRRIRALKEAVQSKVEINKQREAKLGEISIQADGGVAAAIASAEELLAQCSANALDQEASLLENISTQRKRLISRYNAQKQCLSDNGTVPDITHVEKEISRLSEAKYTHDPVLQLCSKLESKYEDGERLLEEYIRQLASEVGQEIEVACILESAWAQDQESILLAKEQILDGTCREFEQLVTCLETLERRLCARHHETKEAEALCRVLLSELEDMENSGAISISSEPESLPSDLGSQIMALMKNLKDLRPKEDRPLVLLEPSDTLNGLESLVSSLLQSETAELETAPECPIILDTIYANSPVNTSRPFMPPQELMGLEKKAAEEERALGHSVEELERLMKVLWVPND